MEYLEAESLEICKKAIEDKLNWGSSASWLNYDFEKLNELIFAETNIQLSVSTLKRIFGKTSYRSSPSLTTLNTLARFIGFVDWREFTRSNAPTEILPETLPAPESISKQVVTAKPQRRYVIYSFMGLIVIIALIGFIIDRNNEKPDTSKYAFKADKIVTEGVPNSVVFTYDATSAQPDDSVFIVQTWDISRKKKIDRNGHHHSAMYYYPGYFKAKLIVNREIVKTHNLQIKTDNWLALAEANDKDKMPLYFTKAEVIKGNEIRIDKELLKKYELGLYPDAPKIRLFNQTDMGELSTDNFTFETILKNDFSAGTAACQRMQVLIQCKDDVIIIPLSAPACVGSINLAACGANIQSADADLSGFGADLHQWTTLRVDSRNKQMTFFVNGKKAYSLKFPNNAAGIVGLQYRFEGTGAVKDTWIEGAGGRHDFVIK